MFPPDRKEVEHRIVSTERVADQSDVSSLSAVILHDPATLDDDAAVRSCSTPATPNSISSLPSCSTPAMSDTVAALNSIQQANILSSPFQDLKCSILTTLSPMTSSLTKAAIVNSKKKEKSAT